MPLHTPQHKDANGLSIGEALKQDELKYQEWRKMVEEFQLKEKQNDKACTQ
jgi:hypothetical protein